MTDRERELERLLRRVMDAPCSADAPCGQSSDSEIMALWADVRAFLSSAPAQEPCPYVNCPRCTPAQESARDAAMEEAAKVVEALDSDDDGLVSGWFAADRIRSMKGK